MNSKISDQPNSLRETAQKMIRCLGVKNAMTCCENNHWMGISKEIQAIASDSCRI